MADDTDYFNGICFYLESTGDFMYFFIYVKGIFDELCYNRSKIRRTRNLVFSVSNME